MKNSKMRYLNPETRIGKRHLLRLVSKSQRAELVAAHNAAFESQEHISFDHKLERRSKRFEQEETV